jgi:hypothetical protein
LQCISQGAPLLWLNYLFLLPKLQIKKLDPASKRVSTLAGTGKAGFKDGTALTAQVGKYFYSYLMKIL